MIWGAVYSVGIIHILQDFNKQQIQAGMQTKSTGHAVHEARVVKKVDAIPSHAWCSLASQLVVNA